MLTNKFLILIVFLVEYYFQIEVFLFKSRIFKLKKLDICTVFFSYFIQQFLSVN